MNAEYLTVVNNTKPLIGIQLKRNSAAINLTTNGVDSVDLKIKRFTTGVETNTGHTAAVISEASTGMIMYTPEADDFPAEGFYIGNAILNYTDGGIEELYDQVIIYARNK